MTIKFEKETEVTGEIWFKIWIDDVCKVASQNEAIVKEKYHAIIENAKKGYPIKETIASETIL